MFNHHQLIGGFTRIEIPPMKQPSATDFWNCTCNSSSMRPSHTVFGFGMAQFLAPRSLSPDLRQVRQKNDDLDVQSSWFEFEYSRNWKKWLSMMIRSLGWSNPTSFFKKKKRLDWRCQCVPGCFHDVPCNVGIAIINHPFLMVYNLYHPFMVIKGMVYYCYTNTKSNPQWGQTAKARLPPRPPVALPWPYWWQPEDLLMRFFPWGKSWWNISGWWLSPTPSEKYESQFWWLYIPNIWKNRKCSNHQPEIGWNWMKLDEIGWNWMKLGSIVVKSYWYKHSGEIWKNRSNPVRWSATLSNPVLHDEYPILVVHVGHCFPVST